MCNIVLLLHNALYLQITIQLTDHWAIRLLLAIWLPDVFDNRMPTVNTIWYEIINFFLAPKDLNSDPQILSQMTYQRATVT